MQLWRTLLRAKSGDIADVKVEKVSNLLSEYTETSSLHYRKSSQFRNFVPEKVNKK
jgi:hypothetical protein